MKNPFKYIFFVYQWFILLPVSAVVTILTAVITIIFSYTTKNVTVKSIPAKWWSKFMCYASFISVSVEGLENINKNQSYVIVANHQSVFDIWLIYGWTF